MATILDATVAPDRMREHFHAHRQTTEIVLIDVTATESYHGNLSFSKVLRQLEPKKVEIG